jgi:ppGpp synthetase/RelA/SpoT-type nucleotidyltranferase
MDFADAQAALDRFYIKNHSVLTSAVRTLESSIRSILGDSEFTIAVVTGRLKSIESSSEKLQRKYLARIEEMQDPEAIPSLLSDLLGLRVVCYYADEIKELGKFLAKYFEVVEVTDKISETDQARLFGYRALHLDLRLSAVRANLPEFAAVKDMSFEVQVRSVIQDAWSTIDHAIKYKRHLPVDLERRVTRLAALSELMDVEFAQIRDECAEIVERATGPSGTPRKERLNVLEFFALLKHKDGFAEVLPGGIDRLFDEIVAVQPDIAESVITALFEAGGPFDRANQYCLNRPGRRSALTTLRIALFLQNERFGALLYPEIRREVASSLKPISRAEVAR